MLIIADTNDMDYTAVVYKVTDEEVKRIRKITSVICEHEIRHNWDMRNYESNAVPPYFAYYQELSEEDIEWFMQLIPRSENGIHTITCVLLIRDSEYLLGEN